MIKTENTKKKVSLDSINIWLAKINDFFKNTYAIITTVALIIGFFCGFELGKKDDSLTQLKELNKVYVSIEDIHDITEAKRYLGSKIANEISNHSSQMGEIIKLADNQKSDGIRVGLIYFIQMGSGDCENKKKIIYRTFHNIKGDFAKYQYNKAITKLINEKCIKSSDINQIQAILYAFRINADKDILLQEKEIKTLLNIP